MGAKRVDATDVENKRKRVAFIWMLQMMVCELSGEGEMHESQSEERSLRCDPQDSRSKAVERKALQCH